MIMIVLKINLKFGFILDKVTDYTVTEPLLSEMEQKINERTNKLNNEKF